MPIWLTSFLTKNLASILSVIADILVVAFVGYSIWNVIHPKPTTTQNQSASVINNYTLYPDKLGFAVGKVGGFEFFSYHSNPVGKTIVNQIKK